MRQLSILITLVMALIALTLTSTVANAGSHKAKGRTANISWYGKTHHGRKTASGKRFNMHAMTAAHKTLPFGSRVEIINPRNQKRVIVTINDRGPYHGNRKFDVSRAAAQRLGMIKSGTANIQYRILTKGTRG